MEKAYGRPIVLCPAALLPNI